MRLNGTLAIGGASTSDIAIQNNNSMILGILQVQDINVLNLSGTFNIETINFVSAVPILLTTGTSIDLTGNIINESQTGHISGEAGAFIHAQRNVGMSENFGNIGVNLTTSDVSLGITDVYRRFSTIDIDGNPSIKRYYEITPVNNTNLNATAQFQFYDDDLSGETPSDLVLFKRENGIDGWTEEGGTSSFTSLFNFVELSGITSFSTWAIAEDGITLGIHNDEPQYAIILFPIPVSEVLHIAAPESIIFEKAMLTDLTGKMISMEIKNNNTIYTSDFSDGLYTLTLFTSKGNFSKKLLIKH